MKAAIEAYAAEAGLGLGKIAQPLRLAVTGRTASPGLFEMLEPLGKDETLTRIRAAASLIEKGAVPEAP